MEFVGIPALKQGIGLQLVEIKAAVQELRSMGVHPDRAEAMEAIIALGEMCIGTEDPYVFDLASTGFQAAWLLAAGFGKEVAGALDDVSRKIISRKFNYG